MKYGYVCFSNIKPEYMGKWDELEKAMEEYKENCKKQGFHMKYWGHPYGTTETLLMLFKSENDVGAWQKMHMGMDVVPHIGARTVLAARQ